MTTIPPGALVRDRELPELGPGRIVAELKGGTSRIAFDHQDEMRDVDLSRVDVVRLPLVPGTKVEVRSGRFGNEETQPGEVVEAQLPDSADELCDYVVELEDETRTVSEAEVFPREPESTAPIDQFDSLFWRGPFRFFARWGMHQTVSRLYEDSEGLPALIGARIDPQPHQLRAVRQALWAPEPRFILADTSQRDRLVEAGMIVQCLTARNPDCRTLVITPGLRSREWQTQLELRFGGRDYTRVTESRVAGLEFHELAGVFGDDRMIVSTDLVEYNRDARTMIAGEDWDVVVIDAAHRLDADSSAYGVARELSQRAGAAIVTSPMPRSADPSDLTALFGLAKPDEYAPGETEELETYVDEQEQLWGAMLESLDALAEGLDDGEAADLQDSWVAVTDLDPGIADYVDRLEEGGQEALEELLSYVQSFHGFADIAVRTPVEALEGVGVEWPDRRLEIVEFEPDPEEARVLEKLEELEMPDDPDPAQAALRSLYARRMWETPERFVELLQERGEALEQGADGDGLSDLVDRLFLAPDPTEEDAIWHRIVESAAPLPDEKEWIGGMLGVVQGWQNAVGRTPARFEAAADWIDEHLETEVAPDEPEDDEADEAGEESEEQEDEGDEQLRKVLVVSRSRRLGEAFHSHLIGELGEAAAELYHCELPESMTGDAVERFRHDDDCRVLVVDELAAEGHSVDAATAVVHLEQPLSPERVDARLTRLDGTRRDE
ncbi:MAG: helicase-related protein, partial [Bradymonadaceae bacterium]